MTKMLHMSSKSMYKKDDTFSFFSKDIYKVIKEKKDARVKKITFLSQIAYCRGLKQ